ncbi:MFS transporter [Pseudomonas aeruginosa]|uniref:MFS transporter n=1 Tax=Pseudomonas aeruginosa TaxID=287 RepID=UPI001A9F7201
MPSTVSSSRLGLAGLCILLAGQLLPMIDFSIVNVALDALAHSLGASETELELIVAVYGVAFAVCLAMGGRLGDNYGRRRLFDLGVAPARWPPTAPSAAWPSSSARCSAASWSPPISAASAGAACS